MKSFLSVTWFGHYHNHLIWFGHYHNQYLSHLIPHDVWLHATLPPIPWSHAGLSYHSEQFHIRIVVSSDTLIDWLLSHALIPTLSSLHTQSDASPLTPRPPLSSSLSTIWWTLEVLCHQHLNFLTSNLDQSHNPHLFLYPACQHRLVIP